ncbi:MAG: hypothetical protein AAGH48_03840 [Pseudomonadota bacterium]
MRHPIRFALIAALTAIFSHAATAQTDRARFEVAFEAQETQRRAIIAEAIELTDEEAKKFWPAYDEYRSAIKEQHLRQVTNLRLFADSFSDLDDETSEELLSTVIDIDGDRARTNKDHIKSVRRILSPVSALRYFQISSNMDVAQEYNFRRRIPLAGTDLEQIYQQQAQDRLEGSYSP